MKNSATKEMDLKREITDIINLLNEKISQAEKSGIKLSLNREVKYDGTDVSYEAVTFQMLKNV